MRHRPFYRRTYVEEFVYCGLSMKYPYTECKPPWNKTCTECEVYKAYKASKPKTA